MAVDKLPQILKEKWCFYVDAKDEDWSDLIMMHLCTKEFQLSRESEEKKTEEAQIETNGSRKHRTSLQVRT